MRKRTRRELRRASKSRRSRQRTLPKFEKLEDRRMLAALLQSLEPPLTTSGDFGAATALNQDYYVVGAPGSNVGGFPNAGQAFVFDASDGSLLHTFDNPAPAGAENYGAAVAVSGDTIVVGAWADAVGSTFGAGRAFVYDGVTGNLIATIDNPFPDDFDTFGFSVAVSNNLIAVGEPRNTDVSNTQGAVHVFDATNGSYLRTIDHPTPAQFGNEQFGWSLSLSGNVLAIGQGSSTKHEAFLFDASTGALLHTLNNPTPGSAEQFARAVAIDGNTVAVGAPRDDTTGIDSGTVYLFDVTTGQLTQTINNPLPADDDLFGSALSVSGNQVVVGAYSSDVSGTDIGAAYVFDATTGGLLDSLSNPTPDDGDEFGESVAIAGDKILVGVKDDDATGAARGVAHVFGPPPFEPALSNSAVDENLPAGTLVGLLSGSPDEAPPYTFALVSGTGDQDNASFQIVGGELQTAVPLDFEAAATLSILVEGTNANSISIAKSFTINVGDVNDAPTAVAISTNSINELEPAGTLVGTLTTEDADAVDTFTYAFASGAGDADNTAFSIVGDQLFTNSTFDFERQQSHTIRVASTDSGNLTFQQQLTIQVINANPPEPTQSPRFDARIVDDINDAIQSSNPSEAIQIEQQLFFVADTPDAGTELWSTNGTLSGTTRLTDLVPGSDGAYPRSLAEFNSKLYFVADYEYVDPLAPPGGGPGELRTGLFESDGTVGGTQLVKYLDLLPPPAGGVSVDAQAMHVVNGKLLFFAGDPLSEEQLWVSDGTELGTEMLTSFFSSGFGPSETPTATLGGLLLFNRVVDTFSGEHTLWRTDGTSGGTFELRLGESTFGTHELDPTLAAVNGEVFFVSSSLDEGKELWKTDGTLGGTELVKDIFLGFDDSGPMGLTAVGNTLFFSADTGFSDTGRELWKSNGTAGGTTLVKDIWLGFDSGIDSFGFEMAAWNGEAYFAAQDGTNGLELWKSNGTSAGTQMVLNVGTGGDGLAPENLIALPDRLSFTTGSFSTEGPQLWRTDGMAAGTTLVADLDGPTASGATFFEFLPNGTDLFFRGNDGATGAELYVSDGNGAQLLADLNPAGANGALSILANGLGGVVFRGDDGVSGVELGVSDGTISGTQLIDVATGTPSAEISEVVDVGGTLFFASEGDLWKSDGTASGTELVKDFSVFARPEQLTNVDGVLFFVAEGSSSEGRELWKSDGTEAGTVLVKDIHPNSADSDIEQLTVFDDTLYFVADDGTNGKELWRSFGLQENTLLFHEFEVGPADGEIEQILPIGDQLYVQSDGELYLRNVSNSFDLISAAAGSLMPWNDLLYFSGFTPAHGWELWRTDGSAIGTYLVRDILPGPDSSFPGGGAEIEPGDSGAATIEPKLVFRALVGPDDAQLFATDGSSAGTIQLTSIPTASNGNGLTTSFAPINLTSVGEAVFFEAYEPITGRELWVSNGTVAGTFHVKDVRPGTAPDPLDDSGPNTMAGLTTLEDLTAFRSRLFFSTDPDELGTEATGRELWFSDGTNDGSGLAIDLVPGENSGNPREFTVVGDQLYFAANTNEYGVSSSSARSGELFRLNEAPYLLDTAGTTAIDAAIPIPLIGFDLDGDNVTFEVLDAPTDGIAVINGTTLTYTPDVAFEGLDSLSVRAFDGSAFSAAANVEINVTGNINSVSFVSAAATIGEQDGVYLAMVQLSQPATNDLLIPYAIEGPQAVAAGNTSTGELFIPTGSSTGEIVVAVVDDQSYTTSPQQVEVSLLGNTQIALGADAQHVLTLTENDPLPTLSFGEWQSITESDDTIRIPVMLSAASDQPVTATVTLSHLNSATPDVDFIAPLSNEIVFLPGQVQKSVLVRLVDDAIAESRELISASISTVSGAIVTSDPERFRHLTWIDDNDTSVVTISPAVNLTTEGEVVSLQATRVGGNLASALTVPVTVFEQGASSVDYSLSSPSFSFAANESVATIDVTIVSDGIGEAFEAFTISLDDSGGGFAVGETVNAYVGIYDGDRVTVSLSIGDTNAPGITSPTSIREQHINGEPSWLIDVTATLSAPSSQTIAVPVTVSTGAVSGYAKLGTDFAFSTDDFVFDPGVTEVTRTLEVFDDARVERDEIIRISLEPTDQQFFLRPTGLIDDGSLSKEIEIRDDEAALSLRGARRLSKNGVNEGGGPLTLEFFLGTPATTFETFYFAVSGTASRGKDFTINPGAFGYVEVTFAPGESVQTLNIPILDDQIDERNETIVLELYRLRSGSFVKTGRLAVPIVDNDAAPTVELEFSSDAVSETGFAQLDFDLSRPSAEPVQVTFSLGGSAKLGRDFEILFSSQALRGSGSTKTLVFDPLQTTARIVLRTLDVDGNKTLAVNVLATNSAIKSPPSRGEIYRRGRPNINRQRFNPVTGDALLRILDRTRPPAASPNPAPSSNTKISSAEFGLPGSLAIDTNANVGSIDLGNSPVIPGNSQPIGSINPGSLAIGTGSQGRLDGTSVFFDANFNGVADFLDFDEDGRRDANEPLEPSAATDIDGSFAIIVPEEFDIDGDGLIGTSEGRYVLDGGVDASTGLPFVLPFTAPVGATAINPATTLVETLIRVHGFTAENAYQRVNDSLGTTGFDLVGRNPAYDVLAGDEVAADAYARLVQVSSVGVQLASLASGISGLPASRHAEDAFGALANRLVNAGTTLDLSNEVLLRDLVAAIGTQLDVALAADVIDGTATLIELGTSRLQSLRLSQFAAPEDYLEELTKIKKLAHGEVATVLVDVGAGTTAIAIALADYTGVQPPNFDSRVAAQTVGDIIPPVAGISDGFLFEGDSGTAMMRFSIEIVGEHDLPVSVDYQTVDSEAVAGEDYQATSGTITWVAGDTSPQTIEVPIFGDLDTELDEHFIVQLSNSDGAVIRIDQGVGYILNDEEFVHVADAADNGEFLIYNSRDAIEILNDNEQLLGGLSAAELFASLTGPAGQSSAFTVDLASGDYRGDHYALVGNGSSDSLVLAGGRFESIVHRILSTGVGRQTLLPIDGDQVRIDWDGIEEFSASVSEVDEVIIMLPAGITDVIVEDSDPTDTGTMRVRSPSGHFDPVEFTNPSTRLVIVSPEPAVTLQVDSTDAEFAGTISTAELGDLNFDGMINDGDIDQLAAAARENPDDPLADFDGDGSVTFAFTISGISNDSDWLLRNRLGTEYGDADLDGEVGIIDLDFLGQGFGGVGSGWLYGDFSGSGGATDILDLDILGQTYGYVAAVGAATSTAELSAGPERKSYRPMPRTTEFHSTGTVDVNNAPKEVESSTVDLAFASSLDVYREGATLDVAAEITSEPLSIPSVVRRAGVHQRRSSYTDQARHAIDLQDIEPDLARDAALAALSENGVIANGRSDFRIPRRATFAADRMQIMESAFEALEGDLTSSDESYEE